jgi:anti-sigma B factor antagonist
MTADDAPLKVDARREGPAVVLSVAGEIDLSTVGHLRAACADAEQASRLVVDLRDVGFMDTSGVRLVVELQRAEDAGGAELVLVADGRPVLRLLDMAGLTQRLRIVASQEEALA